MPFPLEPISVIWPLYSSKLRLRPFGAPRIPKARYEHPSLRALSLARGKGGHWSVGTNRWLLNQLGIVLQGLRRAPSLKSIGKTFWWVSVQAKPKTGAMVCRASHFLIEPEGGGFAPRDGVWLIVSRVSVNLGAPNAAMVRQNSTLPPMMGLTGRKSAPCRNRTCGLGIRNPALYPTELRRLLRV